MGSFGEYPARLASLTITDFVLKQVCGKVKPGWVIVASTLFGVIGMRQIEQRLRIRPAMMMALAVALRFGGTSASAGQAEGRVNPVNAGAEGSVERSLPQLKTHAPPGFRLYRSGYRLTGKGALVIAQLCRLPGWATTGPQHLRVERLDPGGQISESHEQYLPRLGLRLGNNCSSAVMRLDTVPNYGETIKLCAISRPGNCP